jgi:hypothetical protein
MPTVPVVEQRKLSRFVGVRRLNGTNVTRVCTQEDISVTGGVDPLHIAM